MTEDHDDIWDRLREEMQAAQTALSKEDKPDRVAVALTTLWLIVINTVVLGGLGLFFYWLIARVLW